MNDKVPDGNPLWDFREALVKADALDDLFKEMNRIIAEVEKAAIKEGQSAGEIWPNAPTKASHSSPNSVCGSPVLPLREQPRSASGQVRL